MIVQASGGGSALQSLAGSPASSQRRADEGRLCPPGRGPSEALLSIAPFAAAGPGQWVQSTEARHRDGVLKNAALNPRKGREPQGERDRETPTHTPKTPGTLTRLGPRRFGGGGGGVVVVVVVVVVVAVAVGDGGVVS